MAPVTIIYLSAVFSKGNSMNILLQKMSNFARNFMKLYPIPRENIQSAD